MFKCLDFSSIRTYRLHYAVIPASTRLSTTSADILEKGYLIGADSVAETTQTRCLPTKICRGEDLILESFHLVRSWVC